MNRWIWKSIRNGWFFCINQEIELEKIIEEYSGYVYKIIKNMASLHLSDEDVEEFIIVLEKM